MTTFAAARFVAIETLLPPLWLAHWVEVGEDRDRVHLDPDIAKYRALDEARALEITAAWRGPDLVGYLFSFIFPHIHYAASTFAQQDIRYLRPDCRGGRVALRMSEAHEAQLRARGVVKMMATVKCAANHDGRLFEAMGWRAAETSYVKVL